MYGPLLRPPPPPVTSNGPEPHLEKPFFGPSLPPKQPVFKAFCDFQRAKTSHNGHRKGLKHMFEHPKWSRNNF